MTALRQRAINIINLMPEPEVERFVTMNIRYEQSKTPEDSTRDEFDAKMDMCQEWAKEAGLTPDDITASIKAVRQRRRQNA